MADSDLPPHGFNIKCCIDGKDVGAYGSQAGVPASGTVLNGNSQFTWTPSPGTHTITFTVDVTVDNFIAESTENNNSTTVTVSVADPPATQKPDLIPRPIRYVQDDAVGRAVHLLRFWRPQRRRPRHRRLQHQVVCRRDGKETPTAAT